MQARVTPPAAGPHSGPMVVTPRLRAIHDPAPQWTKSIATVRRRAPIRGTIVFVIRLHNGEEIRGSENDELAVNENTGVLSVHRVDGFEEVTTHYSPSTWASVTQRVKAHGVRRPPNGAR